jgi:hypothetical protein
MLFALLPAPGPAAPARDATSPLAQVPASAPIVIHLRGLERTKDRLLTLIQNSVPTLAAKAREAIEEAFKKAEEMRSLKGLAKDGPAFLVFTELPDPGATATPKMALVARVTSYTEFRDGILTAEEKKTLKKDPQGFEFFDWGKDEHTYLVDRKGWVVATPVRELAVAFLGNQPGLDGKLSRAQAERLLGTDVGLYVDMAAVNKTYGAQIAEFSKEMQKAMEEGGPLAGGRSKADTEAMKRIVPTLVQAVADSRSLLVTADFPPTGLAVQLSLHVDPASATNTLLREAKPAAFANLGRMPAGLLYYSGLETGPLMYKTFGPALHGVTGSDGDKANPALEAALKQLAAAGPRARLDAATVPPAGLQVWDYADPQKAVEAQTGVFRALRAGNGIQSAVLKSPPEVQASAEKHRGLTLHRARLVWDLEKAVEAQGGPNLPDGVRQQMLATMKQTLGEGLIIWYGTDGKAVFSAMAPDWKTARGYLDRYLDGQGSVGEQSAFKTAREGIPAQTTMLVLLDLPAFVRMMMEAMQGLFGGAGPLPNLPALGPTRTAYLGLSLTLAPERAGFDLWLSATAAGEIGRMFEPLFKDGN